MVSLLLPALVVIVATLAVARMADRLRPWIAAWVLTALCAAGVVAMAGATAAVGVDQLSGVPWLATRIGWCARVAGGPVALVSVIGALVGATAAGVSLIRTARRQHGDKLGFGDDPLIVVISPAVLAIAVPGGLGRAGQIVVTTGMLKALDAEERSAMFAHEMAHLDLHHHLFLRVGGLAAAALPLLRPVHRQLRFATERWADERAARDVGSRSLVARAVAKCALADASQHRPYGAMAMNGGSTEARIAALGNRTPTSAPIEAAFLGATFWIIAMSATQVHHLAQLALDAC